MNILVTGANGQLGNEMQVLPEKTCSIRIFLRMYRSWTFVMNRLFMPM